MLSVNGRGDSQGSGGNSGSQVSGCGIDKSDVLSVDLCVELLTLAPSDIFGLLLLIFGQSNGSLTFLIREWEPCDTIRCAVIVLGIFDGVSKRVPNG